MSVFACAPSSRQETFRCMGTDIDRLMWLCERLKVRDFPDDLLSMVPVMTSAWRSGRSFDALELVRVVAIARFLHGTLEALEACAEDEGRFSESYLEEMRILYERLSLYVEHVGTLPL